MLKLGRDDWGSRRGAHRIVQQELDRAAKLTEMMTQREWTQEQVARHLKMSRAAVAQAVCTINRDDMVPLTDATRDTRLLGRPADYINAVDDALGL